MYFNVAQRAQRRLAHWDGEWYVYIAVLTLMLAGPKTPVSREQRFFTLTFLGSAYDGFGFDFGWRHRQGL